MIQVIEKQKTNWHILINKVAYILDGVNLYGSKSFLPIKPNADNGLRWRINREWVSYLQIKKAIKLYKLNAIK